MGILSLRRPIRKRHLGDSAPPKSRSCNNAPTCDIWQIIRGQWLGGGDGDEKIRVNNYAHIWTLVWTRLDWTGWMDEANSPTIYFFIY